MLGPLFSFVMDSNGPRFCLVFCAGGDTADERVLISSLSAGLETAFPTVSYYVKAYILSFPVVHFCCLSLLSRQISQESNRFATLLNGVSSLLVKCNYLLNFQSFPNLSKQKKDDYTTPLSSIF